MNERRIKTAGAILVIAVAAAAIALQQKPIGAVALRDDTTYAYAGAPDGRGGPADDCVVCHSIDRSGPDRSAPNLWGIVGAKKARSEWFAYSRPLRKKGGVWSADELDAFLANPGVFVPGTSMTPPPIQDPAKRRDIIAFLSTLH